MTATRDRIVAQFGRPTGPLGRLAGLVMSTRASNRARNTWTVEQLGLRPDDRVLEIGYGPGLAVQRAAVLAGAVVGVDHSVVMREQASRRNRAAIAAGRVTLYAGTIADLDPARLGRFDKALAVNVFLFWPDPVATLREIGRFLRPGATIALTLQPRGAAVTDQDTHDAAARVATALRAAGYTDLQTRTLALRPVSAACVLAVWPGPTG